MSICFCYLDLNKSSVQCTGSFSSQSSPEQVGMLPGLFVSNHPCSETIFELEALQKKLNKHERYGINIISLKCIKRMQC